MRADNRLKETALEIVRCAIRENLPDRALSRALAKTTLPGPLTLIAIGKAAWRMARTALECLGPRIATGIVLTKYGHSEGPLRGIEIFEGGHPLTDENSILATRAILERVGATSVSQRILFLLSGGGSSLFELPIEGLHLEDLKAINERLLNSGASIHEINAVRKRLSGVKGGRFARYAHPRPISAFILSDTLGDRIDNVASGPVTVDRTTTREALDIIRRYSIHLPASLSKAMERPSPNALPGVETSVIGDVRSLCRSAQEKAREEGYAPLLLTTQFDGEASACAKILTLVGKEIVHSQTPISAPAAVFIGGEALVRVLGKGKGGRCQEMALLAAKEIAGYESLSFFACGSDGTDGPTDAAGGIATGDTVLRLAEKGLSPDDFLRNNDSHEALKAADGLIYTGPTGTNVNDLYGILVGN